MPPLHVTQLRHGIGISPSRSVLRGSYRQDPVLTGALARAFVAGLQREVAGTGGQPALIVETLATPKHFDAYSVEDGRNGLSNDYNISLRDLVDYYFVPLRTCVEEADVGAFM